MNEYLYADAAFCAPDIAPAQQFQSSQNTQYNLRRGSTIFAAANAIEAPNELGVPHARKKLSSAFGLLMFASGVVRRESIAPHLSAALRARAPPLCAPGERPLRCLFRWLLFMTAASLSFGLASAFLSNFVCESLRILRAPHPPLALLNASSNASDRSSSPNVSRVPAAQSALPIAGPPPPLVEPRVNASGAGAAGTEQQLRETRSPPETTWPSSSGAGLVVQQPPMPQYECSPVAREGDNERLFADLVFTYLVLCSHVFYYPLAVLFHVCGCAAKQKTGEHFSVLTNIRYSEQSTER